MTNKNVMGERTHIFADGSIAVWDQDTKLWERRMYLKSLVTESFEWSLINTFTEEEMRGILNAPVEMTVRELTDQIYDTLMKNVGSSPYHVQFDTDRVTNQFCDAGRGVIELEIDGKNQFVINITTAHFLFNDEPIIEK